MTLPIARMPKTCRSARTAATAPSIHGATPSQGAVEANRSRRCPTTRTRWKRCSRRWPDPAPRSASTVPRRQAAAEIADPRIRFRRDIRGREPRRRPRVRRHRDQPGAGPLRGTADFTFRDESLNARNAFAPSRRRSSSRTTLQAERHAPQGSDVVLAHQQRRQLLRFADVYAAVPGTTVADAVRRPTDRANVSARVDHALTKAFTLRAAISNNGTTSTTSASAATTCRHAGIEPNSREPAPVDGERTDRPEGVHGDPVPGPAPDARLASLTDAPAVTVLDAFTSGGAQVDGGRTANEFELATDIDYARAHSARAGVLLEGGRYRSDNRNIAARSRSASLDDYEAGRPSTSRSAPATRSSTTRMCSRRVRPGRHPARARASR